MDEAGLEQLKPHVDAEEKQSQHRLEGGAAEPAEEEKHEKPEEDLKLQDEIDSLYYGDGCSEHTRGSRSSQFTSATYISKLEKALNEEVEARKKLETELEEIKKISSEISSHLGLKGGD